MEVLFGITVLFAIGEQADDLIERLIKSHAAPKKLTVVSDDHRIQQAGRRRGCPIAGCSAYLDQLERGLAATPPEPVIEVKTELGTLDEWLAVFEPDRPTRSTGR